MPETTNMTDMKHQKIRVACVGAGYFSRYQVEAWRRIPDVELVAICDLNLDRARKLGEQFGVQALYDDFTRMLSAEAFEVVDLITTPETHLTLCRQAFAAGRHVICQKPLAPTLSEASKMVEVARTHRRRFMVHENFRFQPWYRKIKSLLNEGAVGERLHRLYFRLRTGDGWSPDAYLDRQPYFRTMPRLLIYETGIHFIDTFRYLAGAVRAVYADLQRLNPVIAGEDAGLMVLDFEGGARAVWDANRYNEPTGGDPRYTFGELTVEGSGGALRLYLDGRLTLQPLGGREQPVDYQHRNVNFAGDCVYATQRHLIEALRDGRPAETEGAAYLRNLVIQEAVYESSEQHRKLFIDP